jgi:hypothetical protein
MWTMPRKNILVPLGPWSTDLKSVHHALALAERLRARVIILHCVQRTTNRPAHSVWLAEALVDLINNARQDGLSLSHLTINGMLEDEIVALDRDEGIDLLVISADDGELGQSLREIEPLLSGQIIQVSQKTPAERPREEGGRCR